MGLNLRQVWRMILVGLGASLIPIMLYLYPIMSYYYTVALVLLYNQ